MGQSGQANSVDVLLTREVRWFQDGPLPEAVRTWFAGPFSSSGTELRTDLYDLAAAHEGTGIKRRSGSTFDTKHLLVREETVTLAPPFTGHVEDWLKVSRPLNGGDPFTGPSVGVAKEIQTRRYLLGAGNGSGPAGCEVELSSIAVGSLQAWSFCFETFGPARLRQESLMAGIESLLDESPPPSELHLGSDNSHSYPDWLAALPLPVS